MITKGNGEVYSMNYFYIMSFIFLLSNCSVKEEKHLNKSDAINFASTIYQEFKLDIIKNKLNSMKKGIVQVNQKSMKFDFKYFGEKPINGWSLYLSLHGGGGVPDSVNENAWLRHKSLYKVEEGIYLTPRSPSNTWNMWHQGHVDTLIDELIKNMIAIYEVNSNRVFLMGYSAGGDGVYQLAPRMADRFAGAAMMAGHPNEASPLGLRNIGFTLHMGEQDSMYNRNLVAVQWGNMLNELQNKDPFGYKHFVKIHKNMGHWMGGLDTSGIRWISQFERNPYPKKVVWRQDDVLNKRYYWLKNNNPKEGDTLIVSILEQTITVEKTNISNFTVYLNDDLVNMDQIVSVSYNDKEIYKGHVKRDSNIIRESTIEHGDPQSVYFGEIEININ